MAWFSMLDRFYALCLLVEALRVLKTLFRRHHLQAGNCQLQDKLIAFSHWPFSR